MTASIFPPVDKRLLAAIKDAERAIVIAHRNPDGDAIASSLAMREILKALGKECTLLNEGTFIRSDIKRFESEFLTAAPLSLIETNPLVIVLDCSTPDRPGEPFKALSALTTICIDHHSSGEPFTEEGMSYIVPDSPSTTLLVDQVRRELGIELTKELAYYLYFGFATDSGFYHFLSEKTAPDSLRRVADMTEAGVSPYDVYDELHDGRKLDEIKDVASIILNCRQVLDGKVIFCTQPKEMGEERLSDAVYGSLLEADGVRAIFFFKEKEDSIEIGMRSKHHGGLDVGKLAGELGGGGHMHASGVTLNMNLNEAEKLIEEKICKLL